MGSLMSTLRNQRTDLRDNLGSMTSMAFVSLMFLPSTYSGQRFTLSVINASAIGNWGLGNMAWMEQRYAA